MNDQPTRIVMGPFNRVEGDLEVRLTIENGRVARAEVVSTLFRGFERILAGRNPNDALVIVPRICGICSVSQSVAAARALADASGTRMPIDGERALNLIHAAENAADHLTHFNLFFMPDATHTSYAARPWHSVALERFEAGRGASQRAALEARAALLHIMGILAGHWPHTLAIQPGGVTKRPDTSERVRLIGVVDGFRRYLERGLLGGDLDAFLAIDSAGGLAAWCAERQQSDLALFCQVAHDVGFAELGKGSNPLLSSGAYELDGRPLFAAGQAFGLDVQAFDLSGLAEDSSHTHFLKHGAQHPFDGETLPDSTLGAPGYTFCKAPRLDGNAIEVGALARQVIDGHPLVRALHAATGTNVYTRVIARLVELARLCRIMNDLVRVMNVREVFLNPHHLPREGRGVGLCEAARGTLGHWLTIERGRIAGYQIIAPTTFNFSPRDATGQPGPLERALVGTPVAPGERTSVAVQHIVRSYDPCMVCTAH